MRRSERFYIALFVLLTCGFAWGLYLVLQIPLLSGQAYAPYSTYRSDPLGMSAFYNALSGANVRALRNENSLMQIGEGKNKTLLLAGAVDSPDFRLLIEAIERFVQTGGRLVITLAPVTGPEEQRGSEGADENVEEKKPEETREEIRRARRQQAREEEEEEGEGGMAEALMVNIRDRWGFELDYKKLPGASDDSPGSVNVSRSKQAEETLPESLLWRSDTFFDDQADHWRVLYERDGHPVLMERSWDAGSIVLASDTYFLSNEAMLRHRYPALLAWIVGPNAQVLFDETHLGISRDPGIVGLMRRYRLTPLMLGFLAVALLFIWKSSASLVPKQPLRETRAHATETGKSAAAGLNSLLRRSTPKAALAGACVEAWRQDYARARHAGPELQARMREMASQAGAQSAPETVYNEIAAMLKERERK